ncbi:MAG: histidine kinase [Saprospiraceae bacterium]|nr:histidine kinase [Lewinella sp.]
MINLFLVAILGKSQGPALPDALPEIVKVRLSKIPDACLGFWEDKEGIWRLEIKNEYFGVNDKVWTYDSITQENDSYRITIKDAKDAKKTFVFSVLAPGEMMVADPYLMKSYRARLIKMGSSIKKIGVEDLPDSYFGKWLSVDTGKEPVDIRREGILVNGQLWTYHQILWATGKYRITLQRKDSFHLWIPYWIFDDQLTGVFNPVVPMQRATEGNAIVPAVKAEINDPSMTAPRIIQIEDMPGHFFGNWSNRNGDWIFQIRKEYLSTGERVWEYGKITREDDLFTFEVVNWFNQGHAVEVKKFTFRFVTDYWMEVTENGNFFEVFSMPFNSYFHLIHLNDLPDDLMSSWYRSSGKDSLRLSLHQDTLEWAGNAYIIEQILQTNDGFQFTCRTGEKYRLFRFDFPENDFLQVNTNGQTQLFSRQPTVLSTGNILKIILIMLSLAGTSTWLLLRWRTKSIKRTEERKRRQLELEIKALRSQMNPHFLFNSLNSIQNLINKQDTDQANHYLSSFSRLMRKVLNNSESAFVSLGEEVALLQSYCELEALRFDFDYTIRVDPELDTYTTEIPGMLIQPFVENAILHGIEPVDHPGQLTISIRRSGQLLCCTIEDNGIGIEQSRLLAGNNKTRKNSFGIRLAEERLVMIKAHYGTDLKIDILDKSKLPNSNTGTRVDIYLPSNLS